jgi:hypothetical protein
MNTAVRVAVNVAFGVVFLAGLAMVWVGLEGLVFGGLGIGRALFYLAAGFGFWAGLAGIEGMSPGRTHVGGPR